MANHLHGLSVVSVWSQEHVVVSVHGEVDRFSAERLTEHLDFVLEQGVQPIVVDLAGVEMIDLGGLRALLAAHQRAAACGGSVTIRGASPTVVRTLSVTGLGHVLLVEPDDRLRPATSASLGAR